LCENTAGYPTGFFVDVRKRLRGVWRQATQPGKADNVNKAALCHNWVERK